ncbi:MAG TPA: acetyl-CoA carboxylase biotin carboxyl carrier protein subunit [Candidatus Dormibacteraeota bacterium]|nr:acetyl-CoA carboxylase biotin carboxyl carrier protein subunit [Candidatus Dormibacteraeota bacterium]
MALVPVKADIAGSIWKITSSVGDRVNADDVLVIMESMKMELQVTAPEPGTVKEIHVNEADMVQEGDTIVTIETA